MDVLPHVLRTMEPSRELDSLFPGVDDLSPSSKGVFTSYQAIAFSSLGTKQSEGPTDTKCVTEEVNKHTTSNARSAKYELKEVLPAILPSYIYELLDPVLDGMEAYLQHAIENWDGTSGLGQSSQCFEVDAKEDNIPSEEETKGELHVSQPHLQCDVTSLKQALAWVNLMRKDLYQTIDQMSPEEQLVFVHSVYSLNLALMENQRLEHVQYSSEIPKLAALLLGMGQSQQCQYEELCSQDYFPHIVNALFSTVAEHGICFVHSPHVMEAIQVLDESGSEMQPLVYQKSHKKLTAEFVVHCPLDKHLEKKEGLDRRRLQKLTGEGRDGYKNQLSPDMYFGDGLDQEDLRTTLIQTTFVCLLEKDDRISTVTQEAFLNMKVVKNKGEIGESPLSSTLYSHPEKKQFPCKCSPNIGKNASVPTMPSPFAITKEKEMSHKPPVPLLQNTCHNGNQVHEFIQNAEERLKHDMKKLPVAVGKEVGPCPSSVSPSQWCWKTRLKKLSLKNIRYYICKADQSSLEELDKQCYETICHAVVSIPFTDEEAVSLLRILKSRHLNVFTHGDKNGNVPLHIAVMNGSTKVVEELTRICPEAAKLKNNDGETPIHLAFNMHHNGLLNSLLDGAIKNGPNDPENPQVLQSPYLTSMKGECTDYWTILLYLRSQCSFTFDSNCRESDQHTAWFHLQHQPPRVQEALGILNNTSVAPTHEIRTGPNTKPEQALVLSPPKAVLASSDTDVFQGVQNDSDVLSKTPMQKPIQPLSPSAFGGSTFQTVLSPEATTAYLSTTSTPLLISEASGQVDHKISKPVTKLPNDLSTESPVELHPSVPLLIESTNSDSPHHSEGRNPEEQFLPQLQSDLLSSLFPSDEGSGYSEDDECICTRKKQHKRRSFNWSASARNRRQTRRGCCVFQPVGTGSSSTDHSTTSRRRSPLSQRQKEERKRATERARRYRATTSESESKRKENCGTRHHQVLVKPENSDDNSSESDTESNPLIKLSDSGNTKKPEGIGARKVKDEAPWSQSSDVQLSASDACSQVYAYPLQCATDELSHVVEQQPELIVPIVTENHSLKEIPDGSETHTMIACEKKQQTLNVLGATTKTTVLSQQAIWQTQDLQVQSLPEDDNMKSEESEAREPQDRQLATQESLEGFSQHITLRKTLPVLQQKTWIPLPRIVSCALVQQKTSQSLATREEEESSLQQENSNCTIPRTQQHSTAKQMFLEQHEITFTLGEGTFQTLHRERLTNVITDLSCNDFRWLWSSLKKNECKYKELVKLQICIVYKSSLLKNFSLLTCLTEGLNQSTFLQSHQVKPVTVCNPRKSPKYHPRDRITARGPDQSPKCRSFVRTNFKCTMTQLIHDHTFNVFRQVVPCDLHFMFGLSPWRGQPLSRLQKRQFSAVLEVARCNRSAIPADVKLNLDDLARACVTVPRVIIGDNQRGGGGEKKPSKSASKGKMSKQSKTKKESGASRTIDSSQTADSGVSSLSGTKSKGATTFAKLFGTKPDPSKANTDQREKHLPSNTQVTHSLNPQHQEKDKSNTKIEEWEPLTQQSATDPGVLHFANSNHPIEVLRDHFTTYSKCCPRHDIQNIVVISSTCPASEALGPKRRYSSIKDLRKEDWHSHMNRSSSLIREGSNRATQPLPQQNQQVVADSPVNTMRHKEKISMATLATDTTTEVTPQAIPRAPLTVGGAPSFSDRLLAGEPLGVSQKPSHSHNQRHQAVSSSDNPAHLNRASITPLQSLTPSHSHNQGPRAVSSSSHLTHGNRASITPLQPLSSVRHPSPPPSSHVSRSIAQHPLSVAQQREHKDRIRTAAELLHAQDYPRIFSLAYEGRPPPNLPPETHIAYVFITGLAYYKMGNNKDSLSYFKQCMQLAGEYGREGDVTLSCIYIGDIEFAQRNYLEAADQYQRALHRYSRDTVARDFRMILPTQSALCAKRGSALRNASKVVDAIAAYEEAIARAESKKDKLSAHTSLGNLFQNVGENARAVTEYEHSIQLATDLQDFVSLGWAHGNMGNAFLGLYQRDKALHHLEKSLDLTVEHEPTPPAIGRAYNNLGTAYQSLGELEKAEEYYDLSLSQAIYGNDIPGQARVYGNIGNLLMIKKECDRAVPHYTEVLRLSQDKSTVSTARHNRGCAYYEWAESKKKNFLQRDTPSTDLTATKPLLHGPQFEDCEPEYRPPFIPKSIEKYYAQGVKDLDFVIKHHEESLHSIKGSPKGLSLSVSLFETNSRTFHRKQDCLVNMGKFEEALLTAEQSRARTLGELLLKRRGPQLEHQLTSPPSLEQLKSVVARQDCPVVYLSYTGARLLGWVFYPSPSQLSLNMFEVPLSDTEFDGKSFDYHLRYSLNEMLVEKSFEMYKPFKYDDENDPVLKLYDLVAQPVMTMLRKLKKDAESPEKPSKKAEKIIIIPDSYTNLLPMTCLLDRKGDKFWGDDHYFQIMPSLLTMGIMDQLPTVSVSVPVEHQQMLCVVGNPTIPMFTYNGEEWNLGKLPHATKEAEWVSHILNCTPILHEQATKSAVMMRLMNAKVIHLATHGSAAAGFLAFAGMSSAFSETVEAKQVLIYPEEIEGLSITPALVVLSSCDSGRGIVKADGIQGMARAFILAGAQAVLTTLWRVPDESACIFMQFFYQYLVDGLKGTEALHKAILSVRCFSKYSQYIHWSGYQLTGREIQFSINRSSSATELTARLGNHSIFPQLEIVKQLETAFLNSPRLPTDVQVLRGSPGVKPSEPLKDFIHLHHQHFRGGIYWINCRSPQLVEASANYITKMMRLEDLSNLPDTDAQSTLVVFDFSDKVPLQDSPLFELLKKPNVHIVIISKHYPPPDSLQKEIDRQLLRGTRVIDIQPLSTIHTTQRIVHSILKHHHLASANAQQHTFEDLAEFSTGSPAIIDIVSSLLDSHLEQATHTSTEEALLEFAGVVQLGELIKPQSVVRNKQRRSTQPPATLAVREISQSVCDSISSVQESEDIWTTNSHYDSWQVIAVLIEQCQLSPEERLLLFCLSNLNCSPIPSVLVTEMATMIAKASHQSHLASSLHTKLEKMSLLKPYPKPVVYHPSAQHCSWDTDFLYVPQFIAEAIWKDMMSDIDKVMALGTVYKAFQNVLRQSPSPIEHSFLLGLCSLLVDSYELHFELVGKECFQEVYRLFLSMRGQTPPHLFADTW